MADWKVPPMAAYLAAMWAASMECLWVDQTGDERVEMTAAWMVYLWVDQSGDG